MIRWPFPSSASCESPQLEHTLKRERSRADRYGGEFSLVTFDSAAERLSPSQLTQLLTIIRDRTRCIDLSGIDARRAWVVLIDCSPSLGAVIAEELTQTGQEVGLRLRFRVQHYQGAGPDHKPRDKSHTVDGGNGQRGRPADSSRSGVLTSPSANQPTSPYTSPLASFFSEPSLLWKRLIDVVCASTGLVLLSPVLLAAAVATKVSSPGPVLFVQRRSGRGGRPFRMFKFRTMSADAEARKKDLMSLNEQDGPAFKMEHDPRVTPVGRWLRKTSIDELPQLWNVLRGEMSLVGPRPLPEDETAQCEPWQQHRLDVRPGITCFWQICDRRTKVPFVDWMRLDIRYARSQSLLLDIRLIARTMLLVLGWRGAPHVSPANRLAQGDAGP